MGDSGDGGSGVVTAMGALEDSEGLRDRGGPDIDRLFSERDVDGMNSGGERKAVGGDGSTFSEDRPNLPRAVEGDREDVVAANGCKDAGGRAVSCVCHDGRRAKPALWEGASVYDRTDRKSSSATSEPSSVRISLLLSEEL